MSNENTKKNGRTLLLVLHVSKSLPINDVGKVEFEKVGDRKKYVIVSIEDYFDPLMPREAWGPRLLELRNKYAQLLSLGEKDRLEIKVL
jgi:hypothetical protein